MGPFFVGVKKRGGGRAKEVENREGDLTRRDRGKGSRDYESAEWLDRRLKVAEGEQRVREGAARW